ITSFVALLVSLPVMIVVAEFAARRWLRIQNRHYVWAPHYCFECDLEPSVFPDFRHHIVFRINSQGERSCEPPARYTRLYRILVAGGSGPECIMLDQEDSWPVLMQRILERPENLKKLGASHVHVGNIGKSGIGSEVLSAILKAVLQPGLRLDAVIL